MNTTKSSAFARALRYVWGLFLGGFFSLLPITLTIVVFHFSFSILSAWLRPLQDLRPAFLKAIPYSEVLLVIIAIILVGILLKVLLLRPIIHAVEGLIAKIPFVRPVYTAFKQLVQAFGTQDKSSFKKVVVAEFPRDNMYSIGFVTGEMPANLSPETGKKYLSVFIPTTPNPTTGFLIMIEEYKLKVVDLTHQEAMALIISGGIIQPGRLKE